MSGSGFSDSGFFEFFLGPGLFSKSRFNTSADCRVLEHALMIIKIINEHELKIHGLRINIYIKRALSE